LKHFQFSNKGSQRSLNEDSLLSIPGKGFFLVVDGVGKSSGAAKDVVNSFLDLVTTSSAFQSGSRISASSLLKEGFDRANKKLLSRSRSEGVPCCAAATAVVISRGTLTVGWCGDCRLYKITSSDDVQQLTTDHTRLAELIKRGVVTVDEVDPSMRKTALTRTLGDKDEVDCELVAGIRIAAGEKYILCTDGVSDGFTDREMSSFLVSALKSKGSVIDLEETKSAYTEKLSIAEDDHTAIGIFIEEIDEQELVGNNIVEESIDSALNGMKDEIAGIKSTEVRNLATLKRQSIKSFLCSIPSMPKRQMAIEVLFICTISGAVFLSPKIIEIAGQRMDRISFEFFLVGAVLLYLVILKLRLYLKR
jgi:serine/threonine protein phosphatase PrpC